MTNFFSKNYYLTAILALIAVSVIPYINALQNGFVYDDIIHIVKNDHLRDPSNAFKYIYGRRGIKFFILTIEYQLWELNPFGYHLTNLTLHVLNTVSLFFLLTMFFQDSKVPLITGLLFAAHPVHTEVVTGISYRNDLLAMFFFTWSFILYLMRGRSLWFYMLSVVSFLLAIFSKEAAAVMLPLMLFAFDFCFAEGDRLTLLRKNAWYYIPYVLIVCFFLYLTQMIKTYPVFWFYQDPTISYTACKAFLIYLGLLFIPVNLNADHVLPLSQSIFEWSVLISIATVIFFLFLTIKVYSSSKVISFGMLWFFITLFPLSNLIVMTTSYFVADRYLYIPSTGFCLAIAVLLNGFMGIEKSFLFSLSGKQVSIYLTALILGLYLALTINRNFDWRSEYSLWSKTIKQSPNSYNAHIGLGDTYFKRGLYDQAIEKYAKLVQLNPHDPDVHSRLGVTYLKKGYFDEAEAEFKKVLLAKPEDLAARNNLGNIYVVKGLFEAAISEYEELLKIYPEYENARVNLDYVNRLKGRH